MNKSKVITVAIIALFLVISAFKGNHEIKNNAATVKQIQGIYIFYMSEPVKETEYLGSIKTTMIVSTDSDDRLNSTIKKAKKEYPNTEALIFKGYDLTVADAVKFKK